LFIRKCLAWNTFLLPQYVTHTIFSANGDFDLDYNGILCTFSINTRCNTSISIRLLCRNRNFKWLCSPKCGNTSILLFDKSNFIRFMHIVNGRRHIGVGVCNTNNFSKSGYGISYSRFIVLLLIIFLIFHPHQNNPSSIINKSRKTSIYCTDITTTTSLLFLLYNLLFSIFLKSIIFYKWLIYRMLSR
jgi:hypothetical protein